MLEQIAHLLQLLDNHLLLQILTLFVNQDVKPRRLIGIHFKTHMIFSVRLINLVRHLQDMTHLITVMILEEMPQVGKDVLNIVMVMDHQVMMETIQMIVMTVDITEAEGTHMVLVTLIMILLILLILAFLVVDLLVLAFLVVGFPALVHLLALVHHLVLHSFNLDLTVQRSHQFHQMLSYYRLRLNYIQFRIIRYPFLIPCSE